MNPPTSKGKDWFVADQLHFAAEEGDAARCSELMALGYDVNEFDHLGRTPLHYAAEKEHFDVVELLLLHGADVNAHHEPTISNTPLAAIAGNCSFRMAELLLKAGADPRIRGWMQLNAIDCAANRKRGEGPQVLQLLREYADR